VSGVVASAWTGRNGEGGVHRSTCHPLSIASNSSKKEESKSSVMGNGEESDSLEWPYTKRGGGTVGSN